MRGPDSGQGYAKAIFVLAIVAALFYVGIKAIPVYVNNYQLTDYIRNQAVRATVEQPSAEDLQKQVVSYARGLSLPVLDENVKVKVQRGGVTINVDYAVPVDLKVYTWVLHFTPSAESRSY